MDSADSRYRAWRLFGVRIAECGGLLMNAFLQCALFIVILLALAKPLGAYMAHIYEGKRTFMSPVFGGLERLIYRVSSIKPEDDMDWKRYLSATLWPNVLGFTAVYALQRLQDVLPLNPQKM